LRVALSFPGCHRRGGVERVMLECANYLAERGHETHVYSSDWDEASIHEAGDTASCPDSQATQCCARHLFRPREQCCAEQYESSPERHWRVWHLCSVQ
jgi:hypothetical protein